MASTVYGERNGIRARFQLHAQSSDQDLRVALKLAEQQQRLLRSGRTSRRNFADIKPKTYTLSRHNINRARSRNHPSPDLIPHQSLQDYGIDRVARRFSFSSEDRKQEASLGPAPKTDLVPSSSYSTTIAPHGIDPPSRHSKAPPMDETRPNTLGILSPKEQRKANKKAQKELQEKAKQARKMVKAEIKDTAKRSRKALKASYQAASSNPESFVAWAKAYQKLSIPPAEGTALADESANESRPHTSMQWLKALWPNLLTGKPKPPAYPAKPIPAISELPANNSIRSNQRSSRPSPQTTSEHRINNISELDANGSVYASRPGQLDDHGAASPKGKSKAVDVPDAESAEQRPWTAHPHPFADLSLLDSSLPEISSQAKIVSTTMPETPLSEAGTAGTIARYLMQEKGFLRDEIGRLGAQAAAKLRQCATEMGQAEESRNAEVRRALSAQHQRHTKQLEQFTAALKTLQDQGKMEPQKQVTGSTKQYEASGQVLENREHKVARREQDATLQLREALLREKEAVQREREAASREREAAFRERQAASLAAEALKQHPIQQARFHLREDQLSSSQSSDTSPLTGGALAREPDHDLQMKPRSSRFSGSGSVGGTEDAPKRSQPFTRSLPQNLPLHTATRTLEPSAASKEDAGSSFDHQEPHALRPLSKTFLDQFIKEYLSSRSAGLRSRAVPKRKAGGNVTFTKPTGQSRSATASSARRHTDKGKGKELSEDEGDSDSEPRKRRRRDPPQRNSQQRIIACPYSKYDICRYSEMNVTEKGYRGCTSCYLIDISRLKQHLYRVHRRPENYCPRCFEVFESDVLLDEHARQLISCKVTKCPFPERLTDAQVKELKKKWTGKSMEECWYIIFKILFPTAPRPLSPYAEERSSVILQNDAPNIPQLLNRLFRERLSKLECNPVTAQLCLADVQTLLGQIVEESMEELLRQSGDPHACGAGPDSTSSEDPVSSPVQCLEPDQSFTLQVSYDIEGDQRETLYPTSPNESLPSLPSLLDLDLGITDFDKDNLHSWSAEANVSPVSPWHLDLPGSWPVADVASDAALANPQPVQPVDNDPNSTTVRQISRGLSSAELSFPETSAQEHVSEGSASTGSLSSQIIQSNQTPPVAAQPLRTARSQRSLDSGYASISTAQQSHGSTYNSTENSTYLDTGLYDTLAKGWTPLGADEEAFCKQAMTSSWNPYFSESRTITHS